MSLGSSARAEITVAPWTVLHRGIDHTQATADASEGRPQLVNVLRIDLTDPDIAFTSHPSNGAAPLETVSQTGSEFLASTGAQAGVNTSFYTPCCSTAPENKDIIGLAVTGEILVSPAQSEARAALLIDTLNLAWFVNTATDPYSLDGVHTAFAGSNFLIGVGRDLPTGPDTIHPARALVGLGDRDVSGDNGLLYLITIDDGLPGVSDGATRAESAEWLFRFGAHTGANLDGGGSTTMVWRNPSGQDAPADLPAAAAVGALPATASPPADTRDPDSTAGSTAAACTGGRSPCANRRAAADGAGCLCVAGVYG